MPSLLPFLELGVATGLRSMIAISRLAGTLAAEGEGETEGRIAGVLSRPWARALSLAMAAGEMVADKLPMVPDRTDPGPLAGRAVNAAIAGHVLATRRGEPRVLGVLLGAGGALLGAHVGFRVRRALTRQAGLPDLPVALCEDALAIALVRHALADWSARDAGGRVAPAGSPGFAHRR